MIEDTHGSRRFTSAPFGNPDGARADPHEVLHGFVGVTDGDGLSDPAIDLRPRIIVGRLGAGKTMYLRRTYAFAHADAATYADPVRSDLPDTTAIVEVCQDRQQATLDEVWTKIWRRAILRALATHMLFAPELRNGVDADLRERLTTTYKPLVGKPASRRSPAVELSEILRRRTVGAIDRYLSHPSWPDLQSDLASALQHLPPVYFHIDATDDASERAPMYWLRFQKGLFYAVVDLLRDPDFGSRLHVIAGIRDIVYSSILQSKHAGRYRGEPHIRVLDWNRMAIRELLRAKIGRLDRRFRMDPENASVAGWLGVSEIENVRRGLHEPIEDYLLRHTRLLPRDVVALGNDLCQQIALAKRAGEAALSVEAIRASVDRTAANFATLQLEASANQLAADAMPAHAVSDGYAGTYVSDVEYARGMSEELRKVIVAVGVDRFDGRRLDRAIREAERRFGRHLRPEARDRAGLHVLDVLWQQGLLGYQMSADEDDVAFFAHTGANQFHLPLDRHGYVFHSCVTHAVPLTPAGKPVPAG